MQTAQKDKLARFGRALALLLNRSLMYQANHPFIKQSVSDVLAVAPSLLETISPLVFILNRDQFYVDEEMLDPRINVKRTAGLFKSSGMQSLSFEKGLLESELTIFAELFASLTTVSNAESLKEKLLRRGVFNIKVNHVVFKKVTEDDKVVSRDALKKITPLMDSNDQQHRKQFMETLLESVLSEEFAKTLSITNLMANPKTLTQKMIEADLAGAAQFSHDNQQEIPTPVRSGTLAVPDVPGAGRPSSQASQSATQSGTSPEELSRDTSGTSGGAAAAADALSAPGSAASAGLDDVGPTGTLSGVGDAPPADALGNGGQPAALAATPDFSAAGQRGSLKEGLQRVAGKSTPEGSHPGVENSAPQGHGTLLLHQIELMHREVEKHLQGMGDVSLSDLAHSIFEMKKQLLEGIQTQKALGIAYANEAAIVTAANKMTDQVMVELIREEYQTGAINPQRLAHLIVRLIPEAEDLKRLLPQIKQALLEAGMAPAEYLKLIHALRNELQSEDLVRVLQESAESIGLDGDMLVAEVKQNPAQAAELIYLASEIRKGGGDESALSEILVDYVERLGETMAKDTGDAEGAAHLKQVMSDVESTILKKLRDMNVNTNILKRMEQRLNERMDAVLDNMRVQWLHNQTGAEPEKPRMLSVLQTLEHNVGEDEDLAAALQSVREKVDAGQIDENNFSQIHEEIMRRLHSHRASKDDQALPDNVLTSEEVMFILEKEIARAKRYGSPFSALAFAFVTAKPKMKSQEAAITNEAVLEAALEKLSATFREVDYIGQIGKNRMLVLLPMVYAEEGKKALSRVLRLLHATPLDVEGIPVELRVAGVVAGYDAEQTPGAKDFAKHLSHQLSDMVARIRNIQVLF